MLLAKPEVKKATNTARPANSKVKQTNVNTKGNNTKIRKDAKDVKAVSNKK